MGITPQVLGKNPAESPLVRNSLRSNHPKRSTSSALGWSSLQSFALVSCRISAWYSSFLAKRFAVVFLLPHCDIRCKFCVTEDNFDVFPPDRARELLAPFKESGVEGLIFGGGEPTLWPGNLRTLAGEARELGFSVQIGTHAMNLPHGFESWNEVTRWVIPLESADQGPHNRLRPTGMNHHAMIQQRLSALGQVGRSVTVSTVVTAENIAGLPALGQWLSDYASRFGNLHAWHLYRLVEKGRMGSVYGPGLQVPLKDYRQVVNKLKAGLNGDFNIFRREDMPHSREVDFFAFRDGELRPAPF